MSAQTEHIRYSNWHSSTTLILNIKPNSWAQSGCILRLTHLDVAPGDRTPHYSGRSRDKIYSKRTSNLANWEKKKPKPSLICSQHHLGISQADLFPGASHLKAAQAGWGTLPPVLGTTLFSSSPASWNPLNVNSLFLENLTQGRHLVDFVQHGTQFCALLQWNKS